MAEACILLRKLYFCSERVKNRLFSSYCNNTQFHCFTNNAYRILHNLPMKCSAILAYWAD